MSQQSLAPEPGPLSPLFAPWEMPNRHRGRAPHADAPAPIVNSRRPSGFPIVNRLRHEVQVWRESDYYGATPTTKELLSHWFHNDHTVTGADGMAVPFRYYFCQREAIETLVFLYEVMQLRCLTNIVGEYGHEDATRRIELGLGVHEDENRWPKYAFKIATGAGKTKVMSLAIVWSYFNAIREEGSDLARHFVVIAPNLTVFERLRQDFGDARVFHSDPLIPSAWLDQWHLTTVLQDEASGATAGATLYLTNIHRLYAPRGSQAEDDAPAWAGPPVNRATALEVGEALRARIAGHDRVMLLNDEAHHVWDPRSAWNEAIEQIHGSLRDGLCCQLDFSATPRDQKGQAFQHIVVESALGEAVDAGIVKTPVIGRAKGLRVDETVEDASERFLQHLVVGYERWKQSFAEWQASGKTPLMFVMCEHTTAADQIAQCLNTDGRFELLNKRTANLHTNLKGRVVQRGSGFNKHYEFVENESAITPEDLQKLRELSRDLDLETSPYRCIVSVLMLREGWDVKNVTTIVPLRALTSDAKILPEQTLGRGLRRMTPPVGGAEEVVVVVEHEAFAEIVRDVLSGEGVGAVVQDVEEIERHTVSIYPDTVRKDVAALEIALPVLTPAHRVVSDFARPTFEDFQRRFNEQGYGCLNLGAAQPRSIDYQERTLFGEQLLQEMQILVPLLSNAITAPSYYRKELEGALHLRGLLGWVQPILKRFICGVLFGEVLADDDPRLRHRLGGDDVKETIRAVFTPLLRVASTRTEDRQAAPPASVSTWRPFQVTSSPARPTVAAARTLFNLVPCDRLLEQQFAEFLDSRATDVTAFAKNAGPQALRIDYLAAGHRLALYVPDFFVRLADGRYLLVETKGRPDPDVPRKARAAVEWCRSASPRRVAGWTYVFVEEGTFYGFHGTAMAELAAAAGPALHDLLDQANTEQLSLQFEPPDPDAEARALAEFADEAALAALPKRWREAVVEAAFLYRVTRDRGASLAPAFQPLLPWLDEAAKTLITSRLGPLLPTERAEQRGFFEPAELEDVADGRRYDELLNQARNLRKTLVFSSGLMPIGLLCFCLDFAGGAEQRMGGVFAAVRQAFADLATGDLRAIVAAVRDFRNRYVAHADAPLTEADVAAEGLRAWIGALVRMHGAIVVSQ